jgi:hypothetical protein
LWEYIKIAHKYMNAEIRTEAAQFLFGEYVNRIFFAVYGGMLMKLRLHTLYVGIGEEAHVCKQGSINYK